MGAPSSIRADLRTPCGFAFVEYYLHHEAVSCMRYISGTKLDERIIRCDLDPGYKEGRQFGRGKSGGQVRDEFRQEFDSGRGEHIMEQADPRWLGSSAVRRGKKTARTRQVEVTITVRHLCFKSRGLGYGRGRRTKRRRTNC